MSRAARWLGRLYAVGGSTSLDYRQGRPELWLCRPLTPAADKLLAGLTDELREEVKAAVRANPGLATWVLPQGGGEAGQVAR